MLSSIKVCNLFVKITQENNNPSCHVLIGEESLEECCQEKILNFKRDSCYLVLFDEFQCSQVVTTALREIPVTHLLVVLPSNFPKANHLKSVP